MVSPVVVFFAYENWAMYIFFALIMQIKKYYY